MLSNRQKDLIRQQKQDEEAVDSFIPISGRLPKVGDRVEFPREPEFNGVVSRITNDQWKLISIDYGVPGHRRVLAPYQLARLISDGHALVLRRDPGGSRS